jgi:hypothetical protein
MKTRMLVLAVLCLGVAGVLSAQAGDGGGKVKIGKGQGDGKGRAQNPAERMAKRFAAFDADHDGFLSLTEFKALHETKLERAKGKQADKPEAEANRPSAETAFTKLDTDKSNSISPAELAAGGEKMREKRERRAGDAATAAPAQAI